MSKCKEIVLMMAVFAGACADESSSDLSPENLDEAIATYSEIVYQSYQDSLTSAEALDIAIDAMILSPTEVNLTVAKDAWLASREPYLQTEVFRFYDGPIDNPEDGPEGLINAWPLDEVYIDYVEGEPSAGIVNSTTPIDETTLVSLNEEGGEKNIATGYHAIEFLLWGQDLSADGPGERPAEDYSGDAGATRRALYLETVSTLLISDLQGLANAWAPEQENYRKEFSSVPETEALRRILTGMIVLSGFETGGERLQAALDSGDQEDEHSCFSDNTHRDMIQDIQGVQNVWLGSYKTIAGTGIKDVVDTVDSELASKVSAKIIETLALANALNTPFDQEIAIGNNAGRERVKALVIGLREQEELLEEVFRLFNLEIPVIED